jgi:pilus assembly protein FimV
MATAKREQILQEAEKLASRGKLDAAIKEYKRAIDQAPNDTNTLNRLGDLLVRANRIPEAIEVYQRVADHFSDDGFFLKAIAIFKKINRLDPQRTETYEKLADLYFKQGLVVEGRQQLLTLGDWFLRSKQVPEAIRVYRRLAELEPTNLQARAKLVDLLVQAGDVSHLSAEIDPLGRALLGRGMLDEAIKLYHRVLDLGPPDNDFVAPCIEALVAAGRLVPAKELADLAMRSGKVGPDLARSAARAYAETGDLKTAREVLERTLATNGERTDVVQLLGDILLRTGEAAAAKERVLPVVDRLLAVGDTLRAASLVKRLLRSTPGDIDALERALKVFDRREDPDMVLTMEAALADAYFRAQKRDAAVKLYRELWRLDPGNRLFAQRLEALGERPARPVTGSQPLSPPTSPVTAAAPLAAPRLTEAPRPAAPLSPTDAQDEVELEFVDVEVPDEVPDLQTTPSPGAAPPPPTESLPAVTLPPPTPLHQRAAEFDLVPEAFAPPPPDVPVPEVEPSFALPPELQPATGPVAHAVEEVPARPEPGDAGTQGTNAEELFTEAVVFAKYGLTEKAVSHIRRLLALDPTHAGGRELLGSLGGEIVEVDLGEPPAPPEPPVVAAANAIVDLPLSVPPPAEPVLEVAPPSTPRRSRLKLEELETILGIGEKALRGAPEASTERRFEVPEISFDALDLGVHAVTPRPAEAAPSEPMTAHGEAPEPAAAPPPPAAGRPIAPEGEVETLEEPVEFVEVGDVLAGPAEDQLREIDFFIEQGLLNEAAGLLRKLREGSGDHPELNARQALLKARGWEEERDASPAESSAEALFSEEDRFFDLAAELERELADEEIVAEATGSNAPGEVSIEELFKEFQKGVAEQLREEDYDTHFNLGIAYREMGLLDEAIREFQLAAKSPELAVEALSMIGACYLEHGLPEQAADWYARALATPALAPEVQVGLRYELGRAHEANGNLAAALSSFAEVLAVNPSFRDVVSRVAKLKAN